MSSVPPASNRLRSAATRVARWTLGALFIYMGLSKALQPVDFLKSLREYGIFESHITLNGVAAILPWFEVFCGVLLASGVAVAGAAGSLLILLIAFTGVVFMRAWSIHSSTSMAFCAIRFDCGCGNGEILICRKLLENALLILLAAWVAGTSSRRRTGRQADETQPVVPTETATGR